MPIAIIASIAILLSSWTFDCSTALVHSHNRLRDAEITISSWSGCAVSGTVNGTPVQLFMGVEGCSLRTKVPGRFRIRYDVTCGAILEMTDGPAITTPMPIACQTPTPTPTPTPVITESKGPIITDPSGAVWTLGTAKQTLRNSVHVGGGQGTIYKLTGGVVYVLGLDSNWYKWTGSAWVSGGTQEPGGTTATPSPSPSPTPTPTPTPTATPTPVPSPSPSPSPAPIEVVFKPWPASEGARRKLITDMAALGYTFCGAFNSSACFQK